MSHCNLLQQKEGFAGCTASSSVTVREESLCKQQAFGGLLRNASCLLLMLLLCCKSWTLQLLSSFAKTPVLFRVSLPVFSAGSTNISGETGQLACKQNRPTASFSVSSFSGKPTCCELQYFTEN